MVIRGFSTALLVVALSGCSLSRGLSPAATATILPQVNQTLTVAWVDSGNLVVWREGESAPRRIASGGVIQPYVAPDGEHVVFTRGPGGTPETLWVVDVAGTAEQELVPRGELRSFQGGQPLIGAVAWLDETVLYFNTAQQYEMGQEQQDDLYRANVRTREVALILPRTEGGAFTISPDGQWIAVVYAGTYGVMDGRIVVVDPLGLEKRPLLYFEGVSTASEYSFYPRVFWEPDSTALRVAIPAIDLVYDEVNSEPTELWRLTVDGERDLTGTVPASFFGQPQWPENVSRILYLQRVGQPNSNQFEMVLAGPNGENPAVYLGGQAGAIQPPQWIAGTNRFAFMQAEPGQLWIGGEGMQPERLPNAMEAAFSPQFTGGLVYVFANSAAETFELRYGRLDDIGGASTVIAAVSHAFPMFDAVVTG